MGIYTIGGFINSAQNETLVSPTDPMPSTEVSSFTDPTTVFNPTLNFIRSDNTVVTANQFSIQYVAGTYTYTYVVTRNAEFEVLTAGPWTRA